MGFKLTLNATSFLKGLEKAHGQVAFASAKTLTTAAFEARAAVQANLPKWLDVRKPFLAKSVVVNKATKTQLFAEVGFLERAKLAPLLEKGGTRTPARSRSLAVPVITAIDPKKITKSKRPRALLARKDTFSATINGTAGIWQALPGRRLKLLYAYEPTARYETNKIHFYKTVYAVARNSIEKNLLKNVEDAIRSAK